MNGEWLYDEATLPYDSSKLVLDSGQDMRRIKPTSQNAVTTISKITAYYF
jgi:hypothetical protein